MILALVKKELRETWLFAVCALCAYGVYLAHQTSRWRSPLGALIEWFLEFLPGMSSEVPDVPFVQGNFTSMLFFIGAGLAVALGFRQSAWEPNQGTALYLLQLPLHRSTIYVTKLLCGIGLLLACTLLPIVAYASWAAIQGTHAGPFEWSMTIPSFHIWLLLPLVYLAAFASGIRPARWFGSRLLPLVSMAFFGPFPMGLSPWPLIAVPLLLLVAAIFVSDILWEAKTRAF
jgi:ABC-type transport system involved in multi-copper enzyme maturation permease subunit